MLVILAGDFNTLDDDEVSFKSTLHSIVNRATRGVRFLDRIYVNRPCYAKVNVVTSTVRSDHKAIIADTGPPIHPLNKTREQRVFRRRSPAQHALFLQHISQLHIEFAVDASVQTNFNLMYAFMRDLRDSFYPEQVITVTSSDPPFVTPLIKSMLRRSCVQVVLRRQAHCLSESVHLLLGVAQSG